MKKITLKELEAMVACKEGVEWFQAQKTEDAKKLLTRAQGNAVALKYCLWFLTKKMTVEQKIKEAIFAAEKVLSIYEKQHPNDLRPREAIETAKTKREKQSAEAAYDAVKAATYAAHDAAYNDYAVPRAAYAAYASARAANAAYDAAEAAYDAAEAAFYNAYYAAYTAALAAANAAVDAAFYNAKAAACAAANAAYAETLFEIVSFAFNLVFEDEDDNGRKYKIKVGGRGFGKDIAQKNYKQEKTK